MESHTSLIGKGMWGVKQNRLPRRLKTDKDSATNPVKIARFISASAEEISARLGHWD
jgi:hypothetical protein